VTHLGNGEYRIIGVQSGRALDVEAASSADGANISLWDYWGGNNQKWTITATSGGYYRVTAVHSGKVLDVSGISTADGANVHQWGYVGGNNQQWAFQAP
jgi:endoglucanase